MTITEACEHHANEFHHALADYHKTGDLKFLELAAYHKRQLDAARDHC